jgi:hypothetical protein
MALHGTIPARYKPVKRLFVLALLVASLWCATLERLSFDDLAAKSTAIVRGKVLDSWSAMTGGVIYTHYRIQVAETLKGAAQSSVEIMIPGGSLNGARQTFAGSPTLNQGDDFVFFLWTSKTTRITWITGLTQGLFSLPSDGTSDPTATRPASRELMLDPVTGKQVKDTAMNMRLSELRTRIAAALAKGGNQ